MPKAKKASPKRKAPKYTVFIFDDGSTFHTDKPLTRAQALEESLQGEAGFKIVRTGPAV